MPLVCLGLVCLYSELLLAQPLNLDDEELLQKYRVEAETLADVIMQRFCDANKPRFQLAYDDYIKDLMIIAKTGVAPDNEDLYDDLRVMKNNEIFIYYNSQE